MAEAFTNTEGRYVKQEDTIAGFEAILNGEMDQYPEGAFLYCGPIDEVADKAKGMEA